MKETKNEIKQSIDKNQNEIESIMDAIIDENRQAFIELAKQ